MNSKIWIIIVIIVIIILLRIIYINTIQNINNTNNIVICGNDGCPITKNQNIIYKTHVEYKQLRDNNHMISHKNDYSNYIFKPTGPSNIFIIRHGEKIKTKFGLDCNGILRSSYIPQLIKNLNDKNFGIDCIVTAYDYESMHQEQTVMFTSWLMNIPLFMYGVHSETHVAINTIYKNPYFNGKNVLICWEHNCIQTLLKDIITIGVKHKGIQNYIFKNNIGTSELPYWKTNNYKTIYHFNDKLNFDVLEEDFDTCYDKDNNHIIYGKKQKCKN